MTPRERVLAAFRHEETDRAPIDCGGHRSSGIAAIAYARLKRQLGITSGEIYVYDMIQQLAIVEPEVREVLGADVVELGRGFLREANGLARLGVARRNALQDSSLRTRSATR